MSDTWYPVTPTMPPPNVLVRVYWAGRIFDATRARHPNTKKIAWVTIRDNEMVWLPPLKTRFRELSWHDEMGRDPESFQILSKNYTGPLPEPVITSPNMQRSINAYREGSQSLDRAEWWRDSTLMTYSDTPTLREVEGRIMRALCTHRVSRETIGEQRVVSNSENFDFNILSAIAEFEQQYPQSAWRPKFKPQARDIDDELTALGWFARLYPVEMRPKRWQPGDLNREQRVLVFRSCDPPYTFGDIADKYKVTRTRAKQIYDRSIERCWRAANGLRMFRHFSPSDQIAQVKERNRKSRIGTR